MSNLQIPSLRVNSAVDVNNNFLIMSSNSSNKDYYWNLVKERINGSISSIKEAPNNGWIAYTGPILEGIAVLGSVPRQYGLLPDKMLSRSTLAGILDKASGLWLIRFDFPHIGVAYPHININCKLTGFIDPHIKIPAIVLRGCNIANKSLQYVSKAAFITSATVDVYRFGSSVLKDLSKKGKLGLGTVKTISSMVGGWSCAYLGGVGGNIVGTWIGKTTGYLVFEGHGVVPGAVGSLVGATLVGIGGAVTGSEIAVAIVDNYDDVLQRLKSESVHYTGLLSSKL